MLDNITSSLKAFYAKPFNSDGNALQWTAFLGFVLIVIFLWSRVVRELTAL